MHTGQDERRAPSRFPGSGAVG